MGSVLTLEKVYAEILSGDRKRFPEGTWSPINGGYDNLRRCLRYLVHENLKLTREELLEKYNHSLLLKYKLAGGYNILYIKTGKTIYELINNSFPEWGIQPWDLNHVPMNFWKEDENVNKYMRYFLEEVLEFTLEEIEEKLEIDMLSDSKFISVKRHGTSAGVVKIIEKAYPDHDWTKLKERLKTGQKGEKHGNSKITEDIVRQILKMSKEGVKNVDIAKHFGMNKVNVGEIINKKAWKHVNIIE